MKSHFNKRVNIGFVRIIFTKSCFISIGSLSKSHSLHISQLNESDYGFTESRWQIIISWTLHRVNKLSDSASPFS